MLGKERSSERFQNLTQKEISIYMVRQRETPEPGCGTLLGLIIMNGKEKERVRSWEPKDRCSRKGIGFVALRFCFSQWLFGISYRRPVPGGPAFTFWNESCGFVVAYVTTGVSLLV